MARQIQVTFDRLDPEMLAGFWAAALHDAVEAPPEGYRTWHQHLADREVPEDEWDAGASIVDVEAERLIGLRATRICSRDEGGDDRTVMADPDGNEFCLH
ncbi:MAG: VOC family protein [Chloroflexota bacterium]